MLGLLSVHDSCLTVGAHTSGLNGRMTLIESDLALLRDRDKSERTHRTHQSVTERSALLSEARRKVECNFRKPS